MRNDTYLTLSLRKGCLCLGDVPVGDDPRKPGVRLTVPLMSYTRTLSQNKGLYWQCSDFITAVLMHAPSCAYWTSRTVLLFSLVLKTPATEHHQRVCRCTSKPVRVCLFKSLDLACALPSETTDGNRRRTQHVNLELGEVNDKEDRLDKWGC